MSKICFSFILDSKVVDASTFRQRSNSAAGVTGPKWWHLPPKVKRSDCSAQRQVPADWDAPNVGEILDAMN
jgi:hypothetical protein